MGGQSWRRGNLGVDALREVIDCVSVSVRDKKVALGGFLGLEIEFVIISYCILSDLSDSYSGSGHTVA